jgi:hypothetical protein
MQEEKWPFSAPHHGALRADRETEPCIASYRNPLPFDPNATDLLESLLQNMAQ